MKTIASCVLALLGLTLLTGPRPLTPEDEVRLGNLAFEKGDYPTALAHYEKAEARSHDPGLVAFNKAVAQYHLAIAGEGGPIALREAEISFRCCVTPNDPRRAEALHGLGMCLLLRGSQGGDAQVLRQAVEAFTLCLKEESQPELAKRARHDRERARLLLAQLPPPTTPKEGDPGNEEKEKPQDTGKEPGGTRGSEGTRPDPLGPPMPAPSEGPEPKKTDTPAPGGGQVPPVPDSAERSDLTMRDAGVHLEQAAKRIIEERRAYRLGKSRSGGSGAKDH